MMRILLILAFVAIVAIVPIPSNAAEQVEFASLDGPPTTTLAAHLFRAPGEGRHPAAVFLHGCGGLINRIGVINARELAWAERLNASGVSVLMVDSFGPRHHGEMCAPDHFDAFINRVRSLDAYAALEYLQKQDFVRPDRVGVVGWSQGGGVVLNSIRAHSTGRPSSLPDGDFTAAVAFYPASCNSTRQGSGWSSPVPLVVLIGERDVWTLAGPCKSLIEAHDEATTADIHVYPGAYHDFDWPGMPIHEVPAFRTREGIVPIEGMDASAKADAEQRVMAFLAAHLQAP